MSTRYLSTPYYTLLYNIETHIGLFQVDSSPCRATPGFQKGFFRKVFRLVEELVEGLLWGSIHSCE